MARRLILFLAIFGGWNCSSSGLETHPSNPAEALVADWLGIAKDAEIRHAWEEAAHALDSWALLHETDSAWVERRIRVADGAGDWEAAVVWRTRALAENPNDITLRVDLADDLQILGRPAEGVALLEEVTGDSEVGAVALAALAEIHKREEDWLAAAEATERLADSLEGSIAAAWWQAASQLRERAGDGPGAVASMEKALKAQGLLGKVGRRLDRLAAFQAGEPRNVEDAVDLLARHQDPEFRLAGIHYLAAGRFPDEIEVFTSALQDSDLRIVSIASREIGNRGAEVDRFLLFPLLDHADRRVRLAALHGLGPLVILADSPLFIPFLLPDDREVFRVANRILERISGEVVALDLDPDRERRAEIASLWALWHKEQFQG